MSSGLLQVFVELRNLHRTLNYVLYWIHSGCLFWLALMLRGHVGDVLDVWPNEVVQWVQGWRRRGGSERRVRSRSTPSEAKPGSLWTCWPVPSPKRPRVCHRPLDCTRGSSHSSAHPGTLWYWLSSRLRRCEVAWCGFKWRPHQDHNCSRKLCFHHPGHVPVICGNPDLHFEGAGKGLVLTWISREHMLYSGTSPISLVEHCLPFRYDKRLLSLLGFVHNWPTSRWSATKKENWFSLYGNGILLSFLGRQFYCSTLYVHNWAKYCFKSVPQARKVLELLFWVSFMAYQTF